MKKPQLSVVICTYNRADLLKKCLISLTKQTFSNFEVVIVDGGSTDKTQKIIAGFRNKLKIKKIIYKPKELSRARDRGWREARAELIAWIDDDVVTTKNWAKSIIEIMNENKNTAGVSGPTIIPDRLLRDRDVFLFYKQSGFLKWLGKFWNWFFLENKKYEVGQLLKSGAWTPGSNFSSSLKIKNLKEVDYLEACNMVLRRNLIEKVNGFDFDYRDVAEWSELDLAIRIKKLGYQLIFSPQVKVSHQISQAGVYQRRTASKLRMENFFKFYFTHVFKPQFNYIFKFSCYVIFLNFYWLYKTISTKNTNWLGGWLGTLTGLKFLFK